MAADSVLGFPSRKRRAVLTTDSTPAAGRVRRLSLQHSTHTMHDETAAAVRALVAALMANPEDIRLMRPYGDLPQHLIDFLQDHESDLEQDLP